MECMLLLWDELDDITHAARHVAGAAMVEFAHVAAPLATAGSLLTVLLLLPM
jgi:hypothetical protein